MNAPNESTDNDTFANDPVFFAEQLTWIAAGPVVSRLSFGVSTSQDGEEAVRVVTLVFPTPSIYDLIQNLTNTFHDPKFRAHASKMVESYGRMLRHAPPVVMPQLSNEEPTSEQP